MGHNPLDQPLPRNNDQTIKLKKKSCIGKIDINSFFPGNIEEKTCNLFKLFHCLLKLFGKKLERFDSHGGLYSQHYLFNEQQTCLAILHYNFSSQKIHALDTRCAFMYGMYSYIPEILFNGKILTISIAAKTLYGIGDGRNPIF